MIDFMCSFGKTHVGEVVETYLFDAQSRKRRRMEPKTVCWDWLSWVQHAIEASTLKMKSAQLRVL